MTTEKQIIANRRNSQSSTGPKTEDGKQKSSQNAVTHGLLAKAVIIHGEKLSAFEKFRQSLLVDLQPEGAMENLLVEKIANYAWRLRRAVQAEAVLMEQGLTMSYDTKTLDSFFWWLGRKEDEQHLEV